MFQFLIGAMKASLLRCFAILEFAFQFLIGVMKGALLLSPYPSNIVSIPYRRNESSCAITYLLLPNLFQFLKTSFRELVSGFPPIGAMKVHPRRYKICFTYVSIPYRRNERKILKFCVFQVQGFQFL